MKRWVLAVAVLAGCAHGSTHEDPCKRRSDFVPGVVASCCVTTTYIWNGLACVAEMGHCACDCNGPDCAQGFPTVDACNAAMEICRSDAR